MFSANYQYQVTVGKTTRESDFLQKHLSSDFMGTKLALVQPQERKNRPSTWPQVATTISQECH